ncbi:hypothetical protein TWF694_010168 [Orbilia ellipsospora]|uniref:F-box domain-containing protein n=1 Tax=Orbilia ellipsospora TaxID=2528407 RepID=A0AAV9XA89_9PEZI
MNRLPTDVLREVLDQLDPEYTDVTSRMKFWTPRKNDIGSQTVIADLRQFRLVCKRFADLGAQYLFRTIAHRYNSKSFNRLSNLADHPIFASHVKKFIYLMPYFYVQGAKDFTEFKRDFTNDFDMQVGSYSAIFQEPLHCLEVFEEQRHLMNSGDDLRVLKKAMKSFRSLQQVQILSVLGEKDSKLLDLAENYDEWDYVDCKWIPACQHAVDTMLQALDYGRPPVYSFVSPRMNPQSLLSLSPEVQELGLSTWSQLTYLKLNFNHMSDRDWYQTQLENKIGMLSTFFETLFHTAQNLTELHIGFFPASPLRLQLEQVFHGAIWPKLRIFGIESWRLTSDEIINKVKMHAHTLRGIRLASIYLKEGSYWEDIVVALKALDLEWLSLDNIGYEKEFDSRTPAIPQFNFGQDGDDADDEESHMTGHTGMSGASSSFDLGFNISLDGSNSGSRMGDHHSNAGESSSSGSHSRSTHSRASTNRGGRGREPGSPTTSHSLNSVDMAGPSNPAGSSGAPNGDVHLIPVGVVERPGLNGMGVKIPKDPFEDLENLEVDLEDNGVTVTELQMVHWERWVVGRDVYTGKKYFRDL